MQRRLSPTPIVWIFALVFALAPRATWGAQLEILSGSSISTLGSPRSISVQTIALSSAAPANSYRTTGVIRFPRISLAFSQYVDPYQNEEGAGTLNVATGASSLLIHLWLQDNHGNDIELPATLTTGVPPGQDCSGFNLCFGGPGDIPQCQGTAWDPATGNVKYVARVVVPTSSGTILSCATVDIILNARILPGDTDSDGVQNAIDKCPGSSAAPTQADSDADGIGNACDNCPTAFNPYQGDVNANGIGNACDPLLINFQPQASVVPAGYQKDYGQLFSSGLGYGWLGTTTLPSRDRNINADQRLDTFVYTTAERTWESVLPGGVYDVQLAIGDAQYPEGPQKVVCEGTTAWEGVTTNPNQFFIKTLARQLAADGRLTVKTGGLSGITAINYVTATESGTAAAPPPFFSRYVNFQPAASPIPIGFIPDSGALYTSGAGFGWDGDTPMPSRDRVVTGNTVLDTYVYANSGPRSWKIAVPADYYYVQIGIGDTTTAQGPETLVVEGTPWLTGGSTQAGQSLTLSSRLLVVDGFLDVTIGQTGGTTPLQYVSLAAAPRDVDSDGTPNLNDNCIDVPNPTQTDADHNGVGDDCNTFEDQDGDNWADSLDNCPVDANPSQADTDANGVGDVCNTFEDQDADEWANDLDNCPSLSNPTQADTDQDGVGDDCNDAEDQDADEWANVLDNCPSVSNPTQVDSDGDGHGNVCDCAAGDPTAYAYVGEVQNVFVTGAVSTDLAWAGQSIVAGTGTVYDVVTESISALSGAFPYQQATCLADDLAASALNDARMPPLGNGYLYLVRAENSCGAGTYGTEAKRVSLNNSGPCP